MPASVHAKATESGALPIAAWELWFPVDLFRDTGSAVFVLLREAERADVGEWRRGYASGADLQRVQTRARSRADQYGWAGRHQLSQVVAS